MLKREYAYEGSSCPFLEWRRIKITTPNDELNERFSLDSTMFSDTTGDIHFKRFLITDDDCSYIFDNEHVTVSYDGLSFNIKYVDYADARYT